MIESSRTLEASPCLFLVGTLSSTISLGECKAYISTNLSLSRESFVAINPEKCVSWPGVDHPLVNTKENVWRRRLGQTKNNFPLHFAHSSLAAAMIRSCKCVNLFAC